MRKLAPAVWALAVAVLFSACAGSAKSQNIAKQSEPTPKFAFEPAERDGLAVAAQDGGSDLLLDRSSMRVGISSEGTRQWSSPGAEITDLLPEEIKNEMLSQIVIDYYDARQLPQRMNSYSDSFAKGQYEIFGIENGFRIEYVIGEAESIDLFPMALSTETMEKEILPKLDEESAEQLKSYFILTVFEDTDKEIVSEVRRQFANFGEVDLYIARNLSVKVKEKLTDLLKQAGFDADMLISENQKIGNVTEVKPSPSFFIPVEFTLEGGELVARVPCGEIEYDTANFHITQLELLPFFGCAPADENGYLFMPDGCGVIIDFETEIPEALTLSIYGADANQNEETFDAEITPPACLPVYGIKRNDSAFLAIIEQGDALAEISAYSKSNPARVSYISSKFTIWQRLSYKPNGIVIGTEFVRYGASRYQGDIRLRIIPLAKDEASYSGMAVKYREKLFSGSDKKASYEGALLIDTYGVIDRTEKFLNFNVERTRALTTINQLEKMLADLDENDLVIKYNNYQSDEFSNRIVTGGKPSKLIGGEGGLNSLLKTAGERNGAVYVGKQILFAGEDGIGDDFKRRRDAALTTENGYATNLYDRNDLTKYRFIVNNPALKRLFEELRDEEDLQAAGISLSDIGGALATNYDRDAFTTRQDMLETIRSGIAKLSEKRSVITNSGGAYVLPFVDLVSDLPVYGSGSRLQSNCVPFLQIVLSGRVSYSGESFNLSSNPEEYILKTAETGGLIHFTLNASEATVLRKSEYGKMFRTEYKLLAHEIKELRARFETLYRSTAGAAITAHRVEGKIAFTEYDNGCTVITNYGEQSAVVGKDSVPAKDFVISRS